MISMRELNPSSEPCDAVTKQNLEILLERLNRVRVAWARPMTITSGLRSMAHHLRIYEQQNAQRRAAGKPELKVPLTSKHLYGQAADVYDPDGELYAWCQANVALLEEIGLWMELKDDQPRVHFQIVPPRSGNRFFLAA